MSLHRLSLFRRIMRLHQLKLPDLERTLGNQYARQEFRAHREVKPEQEEKFLRGWEDYAAHLSLEVDVFGLGRDLPEKQVENLTDDQKIQLQKLHASAVSIGVQTRADASTNPVQDK